MSCTSSLHSVMYYICCIGEADTSQTEENIYATSKYVLLQNDGRTTTNSASMCENSTGVHDKFMKSKFSSSGSSARVSKRAFNRWMVAYTLLKNEQLIVCIEICAVNQLSDMFVIGFFCRQ